MAPRLGTLEWARQTRGVLRNRERARLVAQALSRRLARTIPWRDRREMTDFDARDLEPPDSRAAREAEHALAELGESPIVNHSHRAFAFGTLFARRDGVAHDRELLYVAAMLHDLGLDGPRVAREAPAPCFTLVGADASMEVARAAGWDDGRARRAAEAITLHMNLQVPPQEGPEAHLLTAGALLDAIGARMEHLAHGARAAVLERHPRHGTKRALADAFTHQAKVSPGSRAALYERIGGRRYTLRAPYEE